MPEVVHKYPLACMSGRALVTMPRRRRVLSLQAQDNVPCVWAMIDPDSPLETVAFDCVPTGVPVPETAGPYLGTVLLDGGVFVLHIFEGA